MTPSYSLRFETGDRRGEVIPMTGSTFRIGRKAANDLQIVENSVSGEHAELRLDDEGAVLVDLGSTNGTRVGSDRILEMRIRPGAKLTLGNVEMTFEQGTPASAPAVAPSVPETSPASARAPTRAPAASAEPASDPLAALEKTVEQPAGELIEVSAEDLARARGGRGSRMGLLLVVVLAVAGGGAWWWTQRGGGGSRRRTRPVVQVAGNLLGTDFSFEEGDDWSSAESATGSFTRSARSRFSGEMGLGVSLGPGEDALHVSPWVPVRAGTRLVATCELRAPGAAHGLVGIELLPASAVDEEGDAQGMLGWSAPLSDEPAFQAVEVAAVVPPGYSRARVLVAGEAAGEAVVDGDDDGDVADDGGTDSGSDGGRVEFDDARLVASGGGAPSASLEEYRLYPLGRAFSLLKIQRTLLDQIRLRSGGASAREAEVLTPSATSDGLTLGLAGHLPATLFFRARPEALASASGAGGLATMGEAGYSLRSEDFEDEAVTDLLLGSGVDLVRLSFGGPVRLRGRRVGSTFSFRVDLPAGAEPLIQLRFQREREATVNLAADAEAAERRGDLGGCLSHWQKLLDEYPFEQREVARANEVRTRLLREGFDLVRNLSAKVEQAKFFRLINLYSEFRDKAQAIADRYAGSEVEQTAQDLIGRVEEQLRELESDRDEHEVGRLRSILAALEAQGAEHLASEVREYLATEYGVAQSTNSSEGDR